MGNTSETNTEYYSDVGHEKKKTLLISNWIRKCTVKDKKKKTIFHYHLIFRCQNEHKQREVLSKFSSLSSNLCRKYLGQISGEDPDKLLFSTQGSCFFIASVWLPEGSSVTNIHVYILFFQSLSITAVALELYVNLKVEITWENFGPVTISSLKK